MSYISVSPLLFNDKKFFLNEDQLLNFILNSHCNSIISQNYKRYSSVILPSSFVELSLVHKELIKKQLCDIAITAFTLKSIACSADTERNLNKNSRKVNLFEKYILAEICCNVWRFLCVHLIFIATVTCISIMETHDANQNCKHLEDASSADHSLTATPSPASSEKSLSRTSRSSSTASGRTTRSNVSEAASKHKSVLLKSTTGGMTETRSTRSNSSSRSSTPERSSQFGKAKRELQKNKKSSKIEVTETNLSQESITMVSDNYCWECHREGEFICCEMCPRVYHLRCTSLDAAPPEDWACHHCHSIMIADNVENRSRAMQLISVEQLGVMLKFALKRVKKMPNMEPFIQNVDVTKFPTYPEMVLHPVNLVTLEENIDKLMYGSTEAFSADAMWILHNSFIFNGANSRVTQLAKTAIKMIKQEMSEIETCPDCYMNAHLKPDSWFTEACCLAHPLVWARLKGFPYWPAKAVKWHNSSVDVRFFGRHDRAWVQAKDCYLLSEKMPVPLKNKNKTLETCMIEVGKHIKQLKERFKSFVYAPHKLRFNPSDVQQVQVLLPNYKGPPLALIHSFKQNSVIEEIENVPAIQENVANPPKIMEINCDKDDISSQEETVADEEDGKDEPNSSLAEELEDSEEISGEDFNSFSGFDERMEEAERIQSEIAAVEEEEDIDPETERMLLEEEDEREEEAVRSSETEEVNINYLEQSLLAFDRERAQSQPGEEEEDTVTNTSALKDITSSDGMKNIQEGGSESTENGGGGSGEEGQNNDDDGGGDVPSRGGSGSGGGGGDGNDEGNNREPYDDTQKEEEDDQEEEEEEDEDKLKEKEALEFEAALNESSAVTIQKVLSENNDDGDALPSLGASISISRPVTSAPVTMQARTESIDFIGGGSVSISSSNGNQTNKRKIEDAEAEDPSSGSKKQRVEDESTKGTSAEENTAISVTLKSNSSLSISSASDEKDSTEYSGETERIMSMLGGIVDIKRLSTEKPPTSDEESKDTSLENEEVADSLSKISKEISIQNLNHETPKTYDAALANLSSSISINKASSSSVSKSSTPALPPGVTVSNVSVIKNSNSGQNSDQTPRRNSKSTEDFENTSARKLIENTQKVSKEMSSLLHLSKEIDVKPILDDKGDIIDSESKNSCDTNGRLPAGVDTSKLNVSVSITPINAASSDRFRATSTAAPSRPNSSTSAPSRPSSSTSARSSSASPANTVNPSISISGIGHISVKNSSALQENSSVPPPPPLSQQKASSNFNSPSLPPKLPQLPNQAPRLMSVPNQAAKLQHLLRAPLMGAGGVLPPEAGPLSTQLHQASHKLADMMRAALEEMLAGLVVQGTPEARVASLQLELERSNWRHQQEMNEVRHNADVMVAEMRANVEAEKMRAIEEARRTVEQQVTEQRRQMERRFNEKVAELRRQFDGDKQRAVEETKKKQWCANCGKEALFFCCWNTSYCDYPCQQAHWPQHMSVCGQNSEGGGTNSAPVAANSSNATNGSQVDPNNDLNGDMGNQGSRGPTPLQGLGNQGTIHATPSSEIEELGVAKKKKPSKLFSKSVPQKKIVQKPKSSSANSDHEIIDKLNEILGNDSPKSAGSAGKNVIKKRKSSEMAPEVPQNWMDWFISVSGKDGVKENLEGSPKVTKHMKNNPAMANFTDSLAQMGITLSDIFASTPDTPIKKKKKKISPCIRRKVDHVLQPAEITEEMLASVAKTPKDKVHDKFNGTTCHHCRQKTADTKTVCRSGRCAGLRGFFCGPCLKQRYNEEIWGALLDETWECPVCRGICTCSLCRKSSAKKIKSERSQEKAASGGGSVKKTGKIRENGASRDGSVEKPVVKRQIILKAESEDGDERQEELKANKENSVVQSGAAEIKSKPPSDDSDISIEEFKIEVEDILY